MMKKTYPDGESDFDFERERDLDREPDLAREGLAFGDLLHHNSDIRIEKHKQNHKFCITRSITSCFCSDCNFGYDCGCGLNSWIDRGQDS